MLLFFITNKLALEYSVYNHTGSVWANPGYDNSTIDVIDQIIKYYYEYNILHIILPTTIHDDKPTTLL